MLASQDPRLAGRVAFSHPNFVFYQGARFFIILALEMQSVAVGWQVYEITNRPLDLGYVGLAQFLPGFVLFLFAGHAADRFDEFGDVADHCTVCHKCLNPCPVKIDFGDVSMNMRNLLRKMGRKSFRPGNAAAMLAARGVGMLAAPVSPHSPRPRGKSPASVPHR